MEVSRKPSGQSGVQFGAWASDAFPGSSYREDEDNPYYDNGRRREKLGAEPGDLEGLAERLKKRWDPDTAVVALREAAQRNGATRALEKQQKRPKTGDAAVDILEKVFEDGAKELNMQPGEVATVKLLKGGMRDFIDYALDEVERVGRMHKGQDSGGGKGFSWRLAGHPNDNPCLRRSVNLKHVGSAMSKSAKRPSKLEYAQRPVPPEVIPSSKLWPPPHITMDSWAHSRERGEKTADGMSFEAREKHAKAADARQFGQARAAAEAAEAVKRGNMASAELWLQQAIAEGVELTPLMVSSLMQGAVDRGDLVGAERLYDKANRAARYSVV